MKSLTLIRIVENKWGNFGAMFCGDDFMVTTLERRWDDNKPETSCIPAEKYMCKRGHFPAHGETFEVIGAHDRSAILFHKGNYQTDSKGCILIATGYAPISGQLAISASGDGYARFMEYLKGEDEFELTIRAA